MNVNDAKHIIKQNPSAVFEKRKLLLYLPIIFLKTVINNLKINQETVYVVETKISDFINYNALNVDDDIELKYIRNFESFSPFLTIHNNDGLSPSLAYKTTIEKRFSNNYESFVLFHKANPVGYIFFLKGKAIIPQVKTTFKLQKNSFSFVDLYIFKNSRRKKYHKILYFLAAKKLSKLGYEHFWCWLMKHNQISLKAHVKIGIKNVTKIITLKSFLFFSLTKIQNRNFCLSQLIKK